MNAHGGRDERDHGARDPVVEALAHREALGLEEEHLLEVLLQLARPVEVALEGLRDVGVGLGIPRSARYSISAPRASAMESPTLAGNLEPRRRGDDVQGRGRRRSGLKGAVVRLGEGLLGVGEELEEAETEVLVGELRPRALTSGLRARTIRGACVRLATINARRSRSSCPSALTCSSMSSVSKGERRRRAWRPNPSAAVTAWPRPRPQTAGRRRRGPRMGRSRSVRRAGRAPGAGSTARPREGRGRAPRDRLRSHNPPCRAGARPPRRATRGGSCRGWRASDVDVFFDGCPRDVEGGRRRHELLRRGVAAIVLSQARNN